MGPQATPPQVARLAIYCPFGAKVTPYLTPGIPSALCWSPVREGHLFSGWVNLASHNYCSTGMGHPLSMAPCAKAPHAVGFYLGLASAFPAHCCPLHGLVSLFWAITLIKSFKNNWIKVLIQYHIPIICDRNYNKFYAQVFVLNCDHTIMGQTH